MKFLKLTGYGNGHPPLIPLKSITDIEFETNYTSVNLSSGRSVNVVETEEDFEQIISFSGGYIINEHSINNDLPF